LSKFGFGLCCVGADLGPDFLGPFDALPGLKDFEGLLEPLLAPDLLGSAIVHLLFEKMRLFKLENFFLPGIAIIVEKRRLFCAIRS
jgi:hypothetical protein